MSSESEVQDQVILVLHIAAAFSIPYLMQIMYEKCNRIVTAPV